MSGRIDWHRDKRLHQRIDKEQALRAKPIESSVRERPATPGQRARIKALAEELGVEPPSDLTSRGAMYSIQSMQLRVDRLHRSRA